MMLPFPSSINDFKFKQQVVQLLVPHEAVVKATYQANVETLPFPFWSRVWPSAIALSQYLDEHSELIAGKKVLEIGAGLGLPSLLAAHYAQEVICSDYLSEPLNYARESVKLNSLNNVRFEIIDIRSLSQNITADVVLLSDVNYEPELFQDLQKLIANLLKNQIKIVFSTPQRISASQFVERVQTFFFEQLEVQIKFENEIIPISIFMTQ